MTPSEMESDVVTLLRELPLAFIQLHTAVTAPKRVAGNGVKVSGGTRDFVPLNTNADAAKGVLLAAVRAVHGEIAECFGEPRPRTIGVQSACDDLIRWASTWVWHPYAARWVDHLDSALRAAQRVTDDEWTEKTGVVCPSCMSAGCVEVNEETGDHRCIRSGTQWTERGYYDAVRHALAHYAGDRASGSAA